MARKDNQNSEKSAAGLSGNLPQQISVVLSDRLFVP
jgi:hypothetical protein